MADKGKYAPPFSLRLTAEEREKLDAAAGSQTIGDYIRGQLFDTPSMRKARFRRPVQDDQALSEVLAHLGRSRLSSNLNQLAKAVHSGSLPMTPEVEQAILEACSTIKSMGDHLTQALGIHTHGKNPPTPGGEQ